MLIILYTERPALILYLKNINPFVRQSLITHLNHTNEKDIFVKLKTYDHRLFYILSDKGNIIINDKTYPLEYGSIILFQSGTEYMWQLENDNELKFIAVNFDYTHNFSHIKHSMHPIHSDNFDAKKILEHIEFEDTEILNSPIITNKISSFDRDIRNLSTEFTIDTEYRDELLSTIMKVLVIKIIRSKVIGATNPNRNYKFIKTVIEYIQNNYTEPLTNKSIAEHFKTHPVYLNRAFKEYTNKSIHAFILNYRLSAACILLRSEDLPINLIASSVGYSDTIQFYKMFKKHIGVTPKQFRMNAPSENAQDI